MASPLPELPHPPTFTAHWLAINGIQPLIPQNPISPELRLQLLNVEASREDSAKPPDDLIQNELQMLYKILPSESSVNHGENSQDISVEVFIS